VTAGRIPEFAISKGQIARITTGAPMPEGADAVVMVEDTLLQPLKNANGHEMVKIEKQVVKGQDVRGVGYDIEAQQVVLSKGTVLHAAEIGILATVGCAAVKCIKRPIVALMSTGDEIVEPTTQKLSPGQVRDSNRSMLIAAIRSLGADVIDLGIAGDTAESLESHLVSGLSKADIVLTSGGVSMGELDLIQPLLQSRGTIHFGRVLMKPGKPLTFATVQHENKKRLVFGLPGNPVSSIVTFFLSAAVCIRKMFGYANPQLPQVQVKTKTELKLDPERPEYHRANIAWDFEQNCFVGTSTGAQASSRLLSMCSANALLLLPQQAGRLPSGSLVTALVIGPLT
jgi:gephyrin